MFDAASNEADALVLWPAEGCVVFGRAGMFAISSPTRGAANLSHRKIGLVAA
jgi:hypothetical protein